MGFPRYHMGAARPPVSSSRSDDASVVPSPEHTRVVIELTVIDTHPRRGASRVPLAKVVSEPSLGELWRLLERAGLVPGRVIVRSSNPRSLPRGLRVKALRFPHPHRPHSRDAHEPVGGEGTAPPLRYPAPAVSHPLPAPQVPWLRAAPRLEDPLGRPHH